MQQQQVQGMEAVRVLIVDDHALFRKGVSSILNAHPNVTVVGEAENGVVAVDLYRKTSPDAVIMDINMPIMDGLEATRQIRHLDPEARILMLTVSETDASLFEAIKVGASGYVLKNANPQVVVDSILRVSSGEPVIPGNLAIKIIHEMSTPKQKRTTPDVDALTEREVDVLRQLSTGASNKEIANALYISENTVRNHVRNILDKLQVSNRVQAAAYAMREGYTVTDSSQNS